MQNFVILAGNVGATPEGGILSDEIERLNASYIACEIDSGALTAAILRSETVQPQ